MPPAEPSGVLEHNGASLPCYVTQANGDGPVALICPAMGVPASYYAPLSAVLAEAGFSSVAFDLRGQGAARPTPARDRDWGYADLVDDLGAMVSHVRERFPGRPVLLLGHSLGGQVALWYAAQGGDADGLALVAVSTPYFRLYDRTVAVTGLGVALSVPPTAAILGRWPGWAFGGVQPRRLMREWAVQARSGRWRLRGLQIPDVRRPFGGIDLPVFAASVEGDRFAPPAALDALIDSVPADVLTRWHYKPSDGARLDHMRWTRAAGPVVERIGTWWSAAD